jgi:hypothetical protein
MGVYSNHAREAWQAKGFDTAECWHETAEAKALIARLIFLEDMSDDLAGHEGLLTVKAAIEDEVIEVENALDDLRAKAIDDAADMTRNEAGDDVWRDEIEDRAPHVEGVVKLARRQAFTGLTTVEGDPLMGRVK